MYKVLEVNQNGDKMVLAIFKTLKEAEKYAKSASIIAEDKCHYIEVIKE